MMPLTKYIGVLFGFLLFSLGLFAKEQFPLQGLEKDIPFTLFKTQDDSLTLKNLLNSHPEFVKLTDSTQKNHPDDIFWIKLDLEKTLPALKNKSLWYLTFNSFDYGSLFYQKNDSIVKKAIGRFDANNVGQRIKSSKYFSETTLNKGSLIQGRYLFLKVKRVLFLEYLKNWSFSYSENPSKDFYEWKEITPVLSVYIFSGVTGLMAIIMLVFFGYFKKLEFFLYSFYAICMLLYGLKDELQLFDSFLPNHMLLKVWLFEDLTFLIGICYILFMNFYLGLKENYRFAYYVLMFSIYAHVLFLIIDLVFYSFDYYIGHIFLMKALPIWDSVFATVAIGYVFITTKNLIGYLFVAGSAIFMIGTASHFYLTTDADPLGYFNKLHLIIASTIEIVIFAFGLTYKMFIEHVERLNFQQEAFINKNKALRAQVNPHFIFNALSSIQYLVSSNNRVSALKYLSKFSRLTRNILESSIETNVMLNEEIKMIRDYLELESLRFDNAFSYQINIDEDLDPNEIEVPFMILQPFVENAIIHGLLPKKDGLKELSINFKKGDEVVICEIEDSGVGRQVANQRKHIYKKEKKSRGLEVTKQRLAALSDHPENIEIIDKIKADKPLGTKVIIKIPLQLLKITILEKF